MPEPAGNAPDFTQHRVFWRLIGYSALLGVLGSVAGLVFLAVVGLGPRWYGEQQTGWMDGPWWWVPVAMAAGLVVGLLRRAFHSPEKAPGLIEDVEAQHVDHRPVPSVVAISAVSLIGGASLGPEVALGQVGGGAADVVSQRRGLDEDTGKALTLGGIAGAFGGMFSSPVLSVVLVLELARPGRKVFGPALYGSIVAASLSFAIYFTVAGTIFLGIYEVPSFDFADWHLAAAVPLGILAVLVVLATMAVGAATTKAVALLRLPALLTPVVGGLLFGLVGVALPLTSFTGSDQLGVALDKGSALGTGLLVAILVGKMLAFAVSTATGFIGGPIFPVLFLGGVSGILVHQVVPDIPLGLAFACLLAAVPGAIVGAPFTLVLLAALMTQVGPLETAPVLIAVGTASLTVSALKYLRARRSAATEPSVA
ncbi:chloride channel protein [Nocardioides sp. GY 10113]|uniref:chloride channel protein n=1 Tax=Nocardioides sp. GY 10113 TaxID=2569761 RepID=UPI0010A895E3|nr:chloride channel protein [Nocardioides sp. GY 10113]TIC82186.1 chloride channel protein [Nocardioides sp. GY 10113]